MPERCLQRRQRGGVRHGEGQVQHVAAEQAPMCLRGLDEDRSYRPSPSYRNTAPFDHAPVAQPAPGFRNGRWLMPSRKARSRTVGSLPWPAARHAESASLSVWVIPRALDVGELTMNQVASFSCSVCHSRRLVLFDKRNNGRSHFLNI